MWGIRNGWRFLTGRFLRRSETQHLVRDGAGKPVGVEDTVRDVTERKLAEQALRDSELRYRTIVETAQEGIWTIDAESRVSFVNQKMAQMLGYAPEEMRGRHLFEFMDAEGQAMATRNLARRKQGITEQTTIKYRRKDGSFLWAEISATPLTDAQGAYTGSLAMATDITARRRAEQAMRETQAMLNKAQEIAHVGSWWWDILSNRLICSRELLRLYGLPDDLQGSSEELMDHISRAIHPDAREQVLQQVQQSRATGRAADPMEYRVVLADGRVRTLSSYPEVVRAPDGTVLYNCGAVQDITERKQAEQQLLNVARGVSVPANSNFFPEFILRLARALEADYAFIAVLRPGEPVRLETLALAAQGQVQENIVFDLEGTPCVEIVRRGTCSFQRDVRQDYPKNPYLVAMEAQAYVGAPLLATNGAVLGVAAVIYRHSLSRVAAIESMLEIFASRAATEVERLRAEAQMRKLSSAIDQTADSVVITDRDGLIEYVNPAFERTTGYSQAEAVGQTPRLVKSGKQGPVFYQSLWKTILAGEVFSDVLINRRKDGTIYYEEKTITPLKDGQGQVTHFVSTGKDVTERMQTQERLEFMAQHDELTALPNRALLLDRLKQSVARARWHQRMVAVLFIDLDRFKTINDTLGHEAGDQLLQQLGERFSRSVREGDTVGRFGGDEFVILLDDVASDMDIDSVAQKVLDALRAPFDIQRQHLYITASIGISLFPNDGEDGNNLLRNADIAMYRAKEMGKNTYQFYSADMSARAFERLSLESSLRRALGRQEFLLHYQPQFDVRTGRIFGVEALLRWQHPDFGLVPPADFISLLEETGLIVPVGEWVLEEAGRQMHAWNEAGYRNLRLAVNLSPRQAQASTLLAAVQRVLRSQPDATGWLELEITEGLLVQQSHSLMETFDALRALGARLAIDDFGTGYSSLSYLRRLPIDSLKVDRSFVRDVPVDADDSAIVTAIIAMAQSLRLEVIAEGVENAAQRDFLGAYGCHRMQGNLFARPMLAAELTRLLAGGGSASATG